MNKLEAVRKHQVEFLKKLKAIKEPYTVKVKGIDIVVCPNVFPPVTDSQLLATHIKVKEGDRVLDITTGSGLFGVIAGLQGASGVAVDLNPDAVRNANDNFHRFKVRMKAIESDLFQNVPLEKFDYIFTNGPYIEGEITEPLQLSFYGAKSFLSRFFSRVRDYLTPQGVILITFAEWGDLDLFEKLIKENGLKPLVVDKKISDSGNVYYLYELRVKQ